jgi:rubredoxin
MASLYSAPREVLIAELDRFAAHVVKLQEEIKDHKENHVCFGPEDISEDFECKHCGEKHDFQIIHNAHCLRPMNTRG